LTSQAMEGKLRSGLPVFSRRDFPICRLPRCSNVVWFWEVRPDVLHFDGFILDLQRWPRGKLATVAWQ
jgi:hypothetical protein